METIEVTEVLKCGVCETKRYFATPTPAAARQRMYCQKCGAQTKFEEVKDDRSGGSS